MRELARIVVRGMEYRMQDVGRKMYVHLSRVVVLVIGDDGMIVLVDCRLWYGGRRRANVR